MMSFSTNVLLMRIFLVKFHCQCPSGKSVGFGGNRCYSFQESGAAVCVYLVCHPQKFSHVCRTIFSSCSGREAQMEA